MEKVVFILGCTACDKGALGRALARRAGAQIVSTDSMKVYRRMDIGTAKPSAEHRAEIPHHCIDVVEPSEGFSAAQFVDHADKAIETIHSADRPALAVGGTSLYIKALSEGLFAAPPGDDAVRQAIRSRAEKIGWDAMHRELTQIDPEAADRIHPNDERRIVRALEVYQTTGQSISSLQKQWDSGARRYECMFIGLRRDKADQNSRINSRVKRMVDAGLRDEVTALVSEPEGLSDQAAAAVGYAEIIDHLAGRCTLDEAIEQIKINTRRLAKKQRTWHRRFRDVTWFDLAPDEKVDHLVERIMPAVGEWI